MVIDGDEDEIIEPGAGDPHEEAGVGLLVNQDILALGCREAMVEDLAGPVVVVHCGVEEPLAIGRPGGTATGVLDQVGRIRAGCEISDLEGEEFRTLVVIPPDHRLVIGRMTGTGQTKIGFAMGFPVTIKRDLLIAAAARNAEILRLLATGDIAHPVEPGAIGRRHRTVIFLDAAAHFGKQCLLQRLGVRHRRLLVEVLRLQMGADRRIEDGRILEHRLPVVIAHPGVIIRARNTVTSVGYGSLGSDRGNRQVFEGRQFRGGQGELHVREGSARKGPVTRHRARAGADQGKAARKPPEP